MKMCIKRIYCDSCHELVKCCEREAGGGTQVLCFKCGRTLRLLEGSTWKYIRRLPKEKVQPEPKEKVQPEPKKKVQPEPKKKVQPEPKKKVQPEPKLD